MRRSIFLLFFTCLAGAAGAQKGEKTLAVGPLLSCPFASETYTGKSDVKTGIGVEALGQYNLTNKSGLMLKLTITSWGYKDRVQYYPYGGRKSLTLLTLQGGYRYQFGPSDFFVNGFAGIDLDLNEKYTTGCFALGLGKRFLLKGERFIEAGIDLVAADVQSRINFKALISLFRSGREK